MLSNSAQFLLSSPQAKKCLVTSPVHFLHCRLNDAVVSLTSTFEDRIAAAIATTNSKLSLLLPLQLRARASID